MTSTLCSINHNQSQNALVFATTTLTGLPTDVRERIYSYVIEYEQVNQRRWIESHTTGTQTTLPWTTLRPPALIRVNRQLRAEYLPYFFLNTHFQIEARTEIQSIEESLDQRFSHNHRNVNRNFLLEPRRAQATDETAGRWLKSLRHLNLKMRHVQLRAVVVSGKPLGDSLDVEYVSREKRYQLRHRMDVGVGMPTDLSPAERMPWWDNFSGGYNHLGPWYAREIMRDSCACKPGEEVLDIDMVYRLESYYQRTWHGKELAGKWRDEYKRTAFQDWDEKIAVGQVLDEESEGTVVNDV